MPWNILHFPSQVHFKQNQLDLRNQNTNKYQVKAQQGQRIIELFLSRVILEDQKHVDSDNLFIFLIFSTFSVQQIQSQPSLSSEYSLINRQLSLAEARMKNTQEINHILYPYSILHLIFILSWFHSSKHLLTVFVKAKQTELHINHFLKIFHKENSLFPLLLTYKLKFSAIRNSSKSVTQRPQKASGVIQSKPESLRTRGTNSENPSLGAEKRDGFPAQPLRKKKGANSSFFCFWFLQAANRLDKPTTLRRAVYFTESTHPKTSFQTQQEVIWVLFGPVKSTKLAITEDK